MKIKAKHYGFKANHIVALYRKRGEWRIYEHATYSKKHEKELIEEVMSEKRVKREDVKIGTVTDLIIKVGR